MRLSSSGRIALARPDRIGDCVLASCALRDLLAAHPRTELVWIVRDSVAPLFSGPDFPATLVTFNELETPEALAARLRPLGITAIAHLNPHPVTEEAARLAGIPARAGLKSSGTAGALTVALPLNKDAGLVHEADCGRKIINLLRGFEVDENAPKAACLAPAPEALAEAAAAAPALLAADGAPASRYALLHTGAHGDKRRLPDALFLRLAAHLSQNHGLRLALIGGPTTPADLDAALLPDALDLRGRLSLAASAHLIRAAALVVSRDSGPAHLAAALGAPTLCVFPDLSPWAGPRRWSPVGPRVAEVITPATPRWYEKLNYDWYRARALAALAPEDLVRAADDLL